MNSLVRKRSLSWSFCKFLLSRVLPTMVILLIYLMLLPFTFQTSAEGSIIVSPQFEISTGEHWYSLYAIAYDSNNNRFLIAWAESFQVSPYLTRSDIYGQLVNGDGSLYGDRIAIAISEGIGPFSPKGASMPKVAFDPINSRFLVVWRDIRDMEDIFHYGPWNTYGQLVNADGHFMVTTLPFLISLVVYITE